MRAIALLGFLYVFHIPIAELTNKLKFLATTVLHPPGQAGDLLLEFFYAFCFLTVGLLKIIRFLAITVLHAPLGQASYPPARIPICFMFFTFPSMK